MQELTLDQAENRLAVILTAQKSLADRIKANDPLIDIAREKRLLALYEAEWLPRIKELVPDADQRLEKAQAIH